MKFYGPSTRIKLSKRAIEIILLFLLTAHCASGFQRHTSVSLNNNVTLRASPPPPGEPDPVWEQTYIFGQFVEETASTEETSTPSMATTWHLYSHLLPISFVTAALFLC